MIPEAAVAAAARVIGLDNGWLAEDWDTKQIIAKYRQRYFETARAALEAAAPLIAARALEEAADAFEDLPVNKGATISAGTSDWFELFPVQHIRDRAEDIRAAK